MPRFLLLCGALAACGTAERLDDSGVDCPDQVFHDGDGDGFGDEADARDGCADVPTGYVAEGGDCDDTDAAVSPAAVEVCNTRDDDCDGAVDDDSATDAPTWYADADGDTHGDSAATVVACTAPEGFVSLGGDCDDSDPTISPDAREVCGGGDEDCDGETDEDDAQGAGTWYGDGDGDGHGDPSAPVAACVWREGLAADDDDCDDTDAAVSPDAAERCNGVDDDCDDEVDEADAVDAPTWYGDADGDAYGGAVFTARACSQPPDYADNGDDCDDFDPEVHPDAGERCGGDDEDCDGEVDEDSAVDAPIWFTDADGDGHGDPADPGAPACAAPAATAATADDCDDTDATIAPTAPEVCGGGDEDCDGSTDEPGADGEGTWYTDGDGDGHGDDTTARTSCTAAADEVALADDCDDTDAAVSPDAGEDCATAADDDCSGVANDSCWPTGALTTADAQLTLSGVAAREGFARSIEAGDDITGDGVDDVVVVSQHVDSGLGVARVIAGPLTTDLTSASTAMEEVCCGSLTAAELTTRGDLDGDGFNDLVIRNQSSGLVSAWTARSTGWSAAADWSQDFDSTYDCVEAAVLDSSGTAALLTNADLDTVAIVYDPLGAATTVTIEDSGHHNWYVAMRIATPDLDGDGLAGVVFGSYYSSQLWVFDPAPSANVAVTDADVILTGESSLGGAVDFLDADDDGDDDLVAGADQDSTVALYVLDGPFSTWTDGPIASLARTQIDAGIYTGTSMVGADFDRDGDDDLAVGKHVGTDTYVLLGPLPSGTIDLAADADTQITHAMTVSDGGFLSPVGTAVDGYDEGLAIAVIGDDTAATDAGAAYLFLPGF